ncbi:DnaJ domain protein [Hyella patelloides LEGE 07179]|uniref:DnaJ domain protein n=1 Tax=Hyella patelloides LEGE 07179 TaxID=945734 RepID=A0A563VN55_9CYAN|nr:J domain-containing protein [Hyella patelloides]VEP12797.1 DnaJ domain protein [Hyella patelloides LEGE 07179]
MNLQQLETTVDKEAQQPLNARFLTVIANLTPNFAEDEVLLLSYYKQVRATWSTSAIKNLQKATGLKLTNKLNRCRFAIYAAKLQLQLMSSEGCENNQDFHQKQLPVTSFSREEDNNSITPVSEEVFTIEVKEQLLIAQEQIKILESQLQDKESQIESQESQLKQSENFSVLLLTNRLLAPGMPLNGTEESPAMRILGSPKTLTELEANYRELIKREHPDVSPFAEEKAISRFAYMRSLYRITREHWQELKPTVSISQRELEKRMKATVPFSPESFWAMK